MLGGEKSRPLDLGHTTYLVVVGLIVVVVRVDVRAIEVQVVGVVSVRRVSSRRPPIARGGAKLSSRKLEPPSTE